MKRIKSIYTFIISLVGMSIALSSCIYDDNYEECHDKSPSSIYLKLTLPDAPPITPVTRAESARVDFSTVNNLNLILANNETVTHTYYFTGKDIDPNDGNISMTKSDLPMTSEKGNNQRIITIVDKTGELLKGINHVYAVANYGQKISVNTVTDLKALQQTESRGIPGVHNDCMMFGEIATVQNGQIKPHGEIKLSRTISMLSVKLTADGLHEGVKITPKNISLHNVPTSCFIGNENRIGENGTESVAIGQQITVDWGTLTNSYPTLGGHELEENTIPLFMFENLQGNKAWEQEEQINKCPAEYKGDIKDIAAIQKFLDDTQKYSYIQIEAEYSYTNPTNVNDKIAGDIVYRLLLGDNIFNDFNVRRNTYYQVTLKLKGYGGATEDGKVVNGKLEVNNSDLSWRVEMDVRDWGFVKDKFDFDAHAVIGTIDVIGSDWKVISAKENGVDVDAQSWLRFSTDQGGTGWTEPTKSFYIGSNGEIKYFIQPMSYGIEFDDKTDMGKHRTITIVVQNNATKETQEITFTQWVPIKIKVGSETVFMERFEEESLQSWGCENYDLTTNVFIKDIGASRDYNFGTALKRTYQNGNAFYCVDGKLDAPAHLYCYNKSLVPTGASGSEAQFYVLPDQATLEAMINFSKSNTVENMEPMHYDNDYWTSSAERAKPRETIYWDGLQDKFISTDQRNSRKRTRAIYTTGSYGVLEFN